METLVGPPLVASTVLAIIGFGIKLYFDYSPSRYRITLREYVIAMIAIVAISMFVITPIAWHLIKNGLLKYNEYHNTVITGYRIDVIQCEKDGDCAWVFDCNEHKCNCRNVCTSKDSEGNCTATTYKCDTCYDKCPYCTQEWRLVFLTPLGEIHETVNNRLAPHLDRWDYGSSNPPRSSSDRGDEIPQDIVNRAGVGTTAFFEEMREILIAGTLVPATTRNSYDNFLLAADRDDIRENEHLIQKYLAIDVLPEPQSNVENILGYSNSAEFGADKISFVGHIPESAQVWQDYLAALNSYTGMVRYGDIHMVVVPSDLVTSAEALDYVAALKSYWQDDNTFDRDAASKNIIIIAIGANWETGFVDWMSAETGMPIGNSALMNAIRRESLNETIPLTANGLIGDIRGYIKIIPDPNPSEFRLENTVEFLPLDDASGFILTSVLGESGFERISMEALDEEDLGPGFQRDIRPSNLELVILTLMNVLALGLIAWPAAFYIGYHKRHDLGFTV